MGDIITREDRELMELHADCHDNILTEALEEGNVINRLLETMQDQV